MIMRIHRGHTHQQILIQDWQRVMSSPPIEKIGAGNFQTESSPLAGRLVCKPVLRWASHGRAPATTTRRAPRIRNGSSRHLSKDALGSARGQILSTWSRHSPSGGSGTYPVSAFSTVASDTRLGRSATAQPQHSGRGCVTIGETTDDR